MIKKKSVLRIATKVRDPSGKHGRRVISADTWHGAEGRIVGRVGYVSVAIGAFFLAREKRRWKSF